MASTNGVVFPESMEDFLTNPVDIRFGSISGIHRFGRLPRHRRQRCQHPPTD
jgi:hypothetical protein